MMGGILDFMNLTQQTKSPDDLSEALAECKAFAKRGHILANDAVSLLNRVVNNVSEKLQSEIINLQVKNNIQMNLKTIVELYNSGKSLAELNSEYAVSKSTITGWVKKNKPVSVDKIQL